MGGARPYNQCVPPPSSGGPEGRVAQWESARFTRERSLVRAQPCPSRVEQAVDRDSGGDERGAADYLEIPLGLIQAAVADYGAYRSEIDEWIELNASESEAARAAWLAGQAALRR